MRLLILCLVILTGCASEPHVYNTDDVQDSQCYLRYGSAIGYCDMIRHIGEPPK